VTLDRPNPPKNFVLASCTEEVTRVAVVEDGVTEQFRIEHRDARTLVGNIYKGRVVRVLPGINSAFVDAGLARTAFLHAGDLALERDAEDEDGRFEGAEDDPVVPAGEEGEEDFGQRRHHEPRIEDHLREGQEILVQVRKEPIGSKGARLSAQISLPGRFVVLIPQGRKVGVSKSIEDQAERERLKALGDELRPHDSGLIIRTAAEGCSRADMAADLAFLGPLWERIKSSAASVDPPCLVHEDLSLLLRAARDFISQRYEAFILDSPRAFKLVTAFASSFMEDPSRYFLLHTGTRSLFDEYGVEAELARALEPKVWLKSGGTLIIERTEALTSVDVNSGRFVGKTDLEDTIFRINIEAAREIPHQIRLRNIGGIIVLDFIDMLSLDHRQQVFDALVQELRKDKVKIRVVGMSELGLVQMTRKRTRESLLSALTEPCYCCKGKGYLRTPETVCLGLLEQIKDKITLPSLKRLHVHANPRVLEAMMLRYRKSLEELERRTGREIMLVPKKELHMENTEVFGDTN
jgi:ribonuclease G